MANALWKYVRAGQLGADPARARYRDAIDLIDHFGSDANLAEDALACAAAHQYPVCDMLYLMLARRNHCELLTVDRELASMWAMMGSAGA